MSDLSLEMPKLGRAAGAATANPNSRLGLGRILWLIDALMASLGWSLGLATAHVAVGAGADGIFTPLLWAVPAVLVTLAFIRSQKLHLARVCAIRATEMRGLTRSTVYAAAALWIAAPLLSSATLAPEVLLAGFVCSHTTLILGRTTFRSWLGAQRRDGLHVRPVVLIGSNQDAVDLFEMMEDHPEMGFAVAGVVPTPGQHVSFQAPVLGQVCDAAQAVISSHATGAIVVATALQPDVLNSVVRDLIAAGVHVHVSSGLRGISHSRIRTVPFSHEPLLYLEPPRLSSRQERAKRALDLVLTAIAAVVALPALLLGALAIRLEDGGPVLFRQERVGRDGKIFTVYKLRTMVFDAEKRLADLADQNQREDGPLFKMADDPRITRIGRFLRASSLDELPQLLNVLNGSMSLVGPRPALPSEVQRFDRTLQSRTRVKPGITGLWQVEARDNPAFAPYRRLDLFYVENWSLGLDLAIVGATAAAVIARGMRMLLRGGSESLDAGAVPVTLE